MNNEARYVLTRRHLYGFTGWICEHGQQAVRIGILIGIIQNLDPKLHREVLRSIIKAVYNSGDEMAAGRLSRAIVRGVDYIMDKARSSTRVIQGGKE